MTTIKVITEAILALKDRTGSSVQAINKWIETEKKVRPFVRKLCLFVAESHLGDACFFLQMPRIPRATDGDNLGKTGRIPVMDSFISSPSLQ